MCVLCVLYTRCINVLYACVLYCDDMHSIKLKDSQRRKILACFEELMASVSPRESSGGTPRSSSASSIVRAITTDDIDAGLSQLVSQWCSMWP
jgi:hypothetical protein